MLFVYNDYSISKQIYNIPLCERFELGETFDEVLKYCEQYIDIHAEDVYELVEEAYEDYHISVYGTPW